MDRQNQLAELFDGQTFVFEYDTTYLTEVFFEIELSSAQFCTTNHTFQFEEKAIELGLDVWSLSSFLHTGKINSITQATENAIQLKKDRLSIFLKKLVAFDHLFKNNNFAVLSMTTIKQLKALNIIGNKLIMGCVTSEGTIYLYNDMCSYKLSLGGQGIIIDNALNDLEGEQEFDLFPFTPVVLKCIFALLSANLTNISFRIYSDNLLIKMDQAYYKFTMPVPPSNFIETCTSELGTHVLLQDTTLTENHQKTRTLKELNAAQKLNELFQLQTANGILSLVIVKPNNGTRIFTLFKSTRPLSGYKMHLKDINILIKAIEKSAKVRVFKQEFKGIEKIYLEVLNGQHSYANTLIEIRL